MNLDDQTIAVIGLGYVGLPLAVAFAGSRTVIGSDIRDARVSELEARTGYRPSTPVDTGVARFVEWYKAYYGVG